MKDSKDTPPPTIAELWGEFKSSCKDVEFYRQLNGTVKSTMAYKIEASEANFAILRQQLVERCKAVNDIENRYTRFSFCENEIVTRFYEPLISDTKGTANPRADSVATAREMGCAYLFWAWELEHREKEVNGE